jgi:hypothetical protein
VAETLTTITSLIKSPPGVVVTGLTLGGAVWKAFEKWESVASENDKIQVWMWLVNPRTAETVERWPEVFAKMFDRIFGTRHLSARCFGLSALISVAMAILLTIYTPSPYHTLPLGFQVREAFTESAITLLCGKVIADYLSLLLTRFTLSLMIQTQKRSAWVLLLVANACITAYLGVVGVTFGHFVGGHAFHWYDPRSFLQRVRWKTVTNIAIRMPLHPITFAQFIAQQTQAFPLVVSGFVTSGWLWLYFGSVYLLKGARHFDTHLGWLNRRFDIEKHPISSIGFVFGPLAAIVFWAWVILLRVA